MGREKKSLPYLLGMMNCILHGLLTPNIVRKNALNENILNYGPKDKFTHVFTNPPFGQKREKIFKRTFL